MSTTWNNLLDQSEASVEKWLWQADIASDVTLGEPSASLKKILLCLLERYGDENRAIVTRVYQMMQDVDVLCPLKQGYTPSELEAFTAVFLHNLNTWLSVGADTVQAILEFCSLAANKSTDCVLYEAEFVSTVCRAAVLYAHNKSIQRACSNLFLAVTKNALLVQPLQEAANTELLLASTARMLPPILENISFHRTDHGVLEKSLAILHVLASHPPLGVEALRPYADVIVTNLLAILSGDQIPYVDVLAPCLLVLNIVAEGDTALLQIATSLLHKFGKFAGYLVEEDVAHEQSALVVHAFQLLQRIVCDEHVMLLAFDDQPDTRRAVSDQLHAELRAIFSTTKKEHLLDEKEQERLGQVINTLFMQSKESIKAPDFEQTEVEDKVMGQQKLKSGLPTSSSNTLDNEGKGQTWRGVIDNNREEQVLQHAATGEAWTLLSEAAKEIESLKYELMARNSAYTNSPEMAHLVELSRLCQQQSAVAINRADMMHKLFLDAAKRVEELLVENDALRAHVQYYQTQEEEGAALQDVDEEEREESGVEGARQGLSPRSPDGGCDGKDEKEDTLHQDGFVPVLEDRRQTLAAAGIVEGLAYISAQRSKSSIDSSPGRATIDASVSIEAISTCAACLVQYFFNIKEKMVGLPGDQLSTSLIALSSIRKSLKGLGMLDTSSSLTLKDVDIIFSQLHVHYVTLSGFAYALLLCAGRRYKRLSGSALLDKLSSVIKKYFQNASNGGKEDTHYFHLDPAVQIPQEKVSQVQRLLGEGETMALRTIFQSYLPDLPRSLGPSPIKKGLAVVTQGMTLEMIVAFAIDFGLVPNVITRSQIREVFAGIREEGDQPGDEPSLSFDAFLQFLVYLSLRCPSFRGDKDVASCSLEERFGNMLYFLSKSAKGLGKITSNRFSSLAVCKVSESMLSYAIRNVEEKKSHERKGKNIKLR